MRSTMMNTRFFLAGAAMALPLAAHAQQAPANLLPEEKPQTVAESFAGDPDYDAPTANTPVATPVQMSAPAEQIATVQQISPDVQSWSVDHAMALADLLEGIASEGLNPADYDAGGLRAIALQGPGALLNTEASKRFAWLIEDMRDGRTPMNARKQWFVMDPDADRYRTGDIMAEALATGDLAAALQSIAPEHPDYARLREELAGVDGNSARGKLIRANMDRWRWLPRDLGSQYLITNVPEYQLRLTVNDNIVRTYRTIVGKPGRTATPQLAESVEGVILNPTWTVPQSIVKGEGLGARVLANPVMGTGQGLHGDQGREWLGIRRAAARTDEFARQDEARHAEQARDLLP